MKTSWWAGVAWTIAALGSATTAMAADPAELSFGRLEFGVAESAAAGTLEVVRTGDMSGTVTVAYATANGTAGASDYVSTSGTLTFPAGATRHKISIPIVNDTLIEGDETVRVALLLPVGATLRTPSVVALRIEDNDGSPVFLPTVSHLTSEVATTLVVAVRRSGPVRKSASVRVETQSGSAVAPPDYGAVSAIAKFVAGSATTTVPIAIREDALAEGVEAFGVVLSSPKGVVLGTQRKATITITDNDRPVLPVDPIRLGEYHGWHGLLSHSSAFGRAPWRPHPRPYDSSDLAVMRRQIEKAIEMGLNGLLVNWYGPTCPRPGYPENDCKYMDDNSGHSSMQSRTSIPASSSRSCTTKARSRRERACRARSRDE